MKTYLDYFFEISKIPRKPGEEGKIADYLVEFAIETVWVSSFLS